MHYLLISFDYLRSEQLFGRDIWRSSLAFIKFRGFGLILLVTGGMVSVWRGARRHAKIN